MFFKTVVFFYEKAAAKYSPKLTHYIDVIMSAMASQITGASIVYSTVVQAQIKENIKAPRHWPFRGMSWRPVNSPPPPPPHTHTHTHTYIQSYTNNAENVSIWWHHDVILSLIGKARFIVALGGSNQFKLRGDVFFDLGPDKRLSKQSWGWWFETPSHSLWRHRNVCKNWWCRG